MILNRLLLLICFLTQLGCEMAISRGKQQRINHFQAFHEDWLGSRDYYLRLADAIARQDIDYAVLREDMIYAIKANKLVVSPSVLKRGEDIVYPQEKLDNNEQAIVYCSGLVGKNGVPRKIHCYNLPDRHDSVEFILKDDAFLKSVERSLISWVFLPGSIDNIVMELPFLISFVFSIYNSK